LGEEQPSSKPETPISDDGSQSLGIGLAVVARYVRNMNGQIRVRSELGKGTIFGIELPFDHAPSTPGIGRGPLSQPDGSSPMLDIPRSLSSTSLPKIATSQLANVKSEDFESAPLVNAVESSEQHGVAASDSEEMQAEDPTTLSSPIEANDTTFPFPAMDTIERVSTTIWTEPLKVLVAEDNPINARLLTRRLQKVGHQVELSVDGQECYDQYISNPEAVDVILMDIQVSSLVAAALLILTSADAARGWLYFRKHDSQI
jgi:hypothetical protein